MCMEDPCYLDIYMYANNMPAQYNWNIVKSESKAS